MASTGDNAKPTSSRSWFQKVGAPINKLSRKIGAEAFWPDSLEREAEKGARILRSFCIDGFVTSDPGNHAQQQQQGHHHAAAGKKEDKRLDHIPPEVRPAMGPSDHVGYMICD